MKLIRKESEELFSIEQLTKEDVAGVKAMIEGASLTERRVFNPLLRQIKETGI